jgi:hypothetical protein
MFIFYGAFCKSMMKIYPNFPDIKSEWWLSSLSVMAAF